MEAEKKKIEPRELVLPIVLAAVLLILIAVAVIFGGARNNAAPEPKKKEFFGYFDTYSSISDYSGSTEEEFAAAAALVSERLDLYHKLFDIYNAYDGITNINTLNSLAGQGAVPISEELFDFLEYSKQVYTLTGGEVNVAMGSVLSVWHSYREAGVALPEMAELQAAAEHTDINSLVLNREDMTAELLDSEMSLDVGAVAKGYAAERIAELLRAEGYTSFVIDLGGNLRAVGTKPSGDSWRTGVRNPDSGGDAYIYYFDLADSSAVTSGNYERYYTVDGKNYHHIIDKDTLMPSEHFTSVTVITPDSALADALSTALFNMTYDEGRALADSLNDVKVIWLLPNGEVKTN